MVCSAWVFFFSLLAILGTLRERFCLTPVSSASKFLEMLIVSLSYSLSLAHSSVPSSMVLIADSMLATMKVRRVRTQTPPSRSVFFFSTSRLYSILSSFSLPFSPFFLFLFSRNLSYRIRREKKAWNCARQHPSISAAMTVRSPPSSPRRCSGGRSEAGGQPWSAWHVD